LQRAEGDIWDGADLEIQHVRILQAAVLNWANRQLTCAPCRTISLSPESLAWSASRVPKFNA
jgi:hypothetical protein